MLFRARAPQTSSMPGVTARFWLSRGVGAPSLAQGEGGDGYTPEPRPVRGKPFVTAKASWAPGFCSRGAGVCVTLRLQPSFFVGEHSMNAGSRLARSQRIGTKV